MSKVLCCAFVIAVACFMAAGHLSADEEAKPADSVWVGVSVLLPGGEDTEYLIGTVEKTLLDEIELGTYKRKFLRISNLRIQGEQDAASATADEEETRVFYDCADKYDWGIILVRYEDVLSIEFKKGDPLNPETE